MIMISLELAQMKSATMFDLMFLSRWLILAICFVVATTSHKDHITNKILTGCDTWT